MEKKGCWTIYAFSYALLIFVVLWIDIAQGWTATWTTYVTTQAGTTDGTTPTVTTQAATTYSTTQIVTTQASTTDSWTTAVTTQAETTDGTTQTLTTQAVTTDGTTPTVITPAGITDGTTTTVTTQAGTTDGTTPAVTTQTGTTDGTTPTVITPAGITDGTTPAVTTQTGTTDGTTPTVVTPAGITDGTTTTVTTQAGITYGTTPTTQAGTTDGATPTVTTQAGTTDGTTPAVTTQAGTTDGTTPAVTTHAGTTNVMTTQEATSIPTQLSCSTVCTCTFTQQSNPNVTWETASLEDSHFSVFKTNMITELASSDTLEMMYVPMKSQIRCVVSGNASNTQIVTLMLSRTHIELRENSDKVSTTVTPSVPMQCTFDIINPIVPSLSRVDVVLCKCSLIFDGSDSISFNTIAVRDFVRDGETNLTLTIQPRVGSCNLDISNPVNYTIEVSVEDFDGGRCTAASDPHFRSFDGRYYNWYQTGTIILQQNLYRGFEVQGRAWNCWRVSCLCGIALREGNDIVSIDMCDGQFKYSSPKVNKLSVVSYNEGFKIYRDSSGRRFTVTTPSGSSVTAAVTRYWITATITVPSDDFSNSNGSCGYFDGDSANDFLLQSGYTYEPRLYSFNSYQPSSFTDSWSDNSVDSLFERESSSEQTPSTYCKCETAGTDETCSSETMVNNVYAVFRSGLIDITADVESDESSRRRRSTHHIQKRYVFEPTETDITNETLTWPSNGITEQNASDECNSTLINSDIYATCEEFFGNTDDLLDECVEDIQITGSFDSVNEILERFQSQCEQAVVNNYDPVNSENFTDNALVVQLVSLSCPGQCSGNGNCTDGMCSCNYGFEGDDCSVNTAISPELDGLNGEASTLLCDVRNDDCENISAFGGPFFNNGNLQCLYTEDGDSTSRPPVSATFESFFEITCQFGELVSTNYDEENKNAKPSMWLNVRVSTGDDDIRKSTSPGITFIVYDSVCQDCSSNPCKLKDDTCLIDGFCFNSDDPNPNHEDRYCNPEQSKTEWTTKDASKGLSTGAIIGIVVGAVFLLAVVIVIVGVLIKGKSRKVGASDNDLQQPLP